MYKVLKNESDFDDWIRVLPDEVSAISTQTAVKNSLKAILQTFDTAYGKERRIEADLGGFAIVLFGDRTEVSEQEKNVLEYFNLNGMKGKKVLVIGMNPASNSVQVFDNTTNYLLNNLGIMGYSEIVVWNLFADICTKLKPTQTGDNTENIEYLQELLNEKFNAVLIGWGNTFIGNRRVEEAKRQVCEYLKPHAKKVYELVDTDGEYIGLRTIHPLFAGQRFSGKWEFRNFVFPEEK